VSTDTDPQCQERITKNVPWLRMTFNDNSDFAPLVSARDVQKIVEIEDVERGEDFVQAGVSSLDVPFTGVVRPVEGEDRSGVSHYGLRRRHDRLSAV